MTAKKEILVMGDGQEVEVTYPDLKELKNCRLRNVFIPRAVIPKKATLVPFRDNAVMKFIDKDDGESGWLITFAHDSFESIPDGAIPIEYRADTRDETGHQESMARLEEQMVWLRKSLAEDPCKI
jgi:hypothetical protein